MSENPAPEPTSHPVTCTECQAGMMHLQFITYFTWLAEELILVPNFPAWICDVCGRRDYDDKSIAWLSMLLNPDAGRPTSRRPAASRRAPPPTTHPSAQS